jgi:hypothetical protein
MRCAALVVLIIPCASLATPPAALEETSTRGRSVERRIRLVRSAGLAEALDLYGAPAERAQAILTRYSVRCEMEWHRAHEAMRTLRRAAAGDPAAQGEVDTATRLLFDADTELGAVHREMLVELASGLTPEKRARATVFLAACRSRLGHLPEMTGIARPRLRPAPETGRGGQGGGR